MNYQSIRNLKPHCTLKILILVAMIIFFFSSISEGILADAQYPDEFSILESARIPLYTEEYSRPNGVYVIKIFSNGTWQKIGELPYDHFFRTQDLTLSIPAHEGELRFRIAKEGGGAAHIDSILLNGMAPARAEGSILAKVSKEDFDVINTHEGVVEVSFDIAGLSSGEATLFLTARIEGTQVSKVPFQYPRHNTFRQMDENAEFYRYELGARQGRLTPDGDLNGEVLGDPFFAEFMPVGTGHPQGTTYVWVMNDAENLYVAIDFTADNTMDGDEDYTKVYAKTEDGLKEFTISMEERHWGAAGFTYTDRVVYQHKTYEFAIPFKELGIRPNDGEKDAVQLAFAAYGTAGPGDVSPAMAYDPNHHQYLVVFTYVETGTNYEDIYGIFLDGTGEPAGSRFPICTADTNQHWPSVAFDEVTNRFLVAWQDYRNSGTSGRDIYGQLINADGSFYPAPGDTTTNFPICTATNDQGAPTAAYDSVNNRFLVAWYDYRSGSDFDIYGQLVNADGSLAPPGDVSNNFPISTALSQQYYPTATFDPGNSRFLVAWYDYRNSGTTGYDIYGQLVNADGSLLPPGDVTTNFPICTATNSQYYPTVAYDPGSSRFLVAWEDWRSGSNSDIYGQLINTDGSLSLPGDVTTNFPICTATNGQSSSISAYDSVNNRFLVAWRDYRNSGTTDQDIYGQLVNNDGSLHPAPGDTTTNLEIAKKDYSQYNPFAIGNPFCGNFLVAIEDTDGGDYVITVTTVGGCSPAQGLLSFPVGMDQGVSPETGSLGDTFTFQVYYWGADAPTKAELWVDLNSDGSYASVRSFPIVIRPRDSRITLKVLMILSGIALLLVVKKRRPVFSIASLFLVIVLITVAGIIGCETTPQDQEQEQEPEPVPERFTLNEADTTDTDYLDGKLYTLDVTLDTNKSGSYKYKFVFTDWNGSNAYGVPTEEKTITID